MRLLPEFRKAAKRLGQRVNFGTVDCTVHGNLCNNVSHSYAQHAKELYTSSLVYMLLEAVFYFVNAKYVVEAH